VREVKDKIGRVLTAEEEELEEQLRQLGVPEGDLAQRELDLATLRAELRAFEIRYLRTVGPPSAELDQLKAAIAQAGGSRRLGSSPTGADGGRGQPAGRPRGGGGAGQGAHGRPAGHVPAGGQGQGRNRRCCGLICLPASWLS
jgi:hypothetical protein